MIKRILFATLVAVAALIPDAASAQCSGVMGAGQLCGNSTASSGLGAPRTMTSMLDRALCGTNNSAIARISGTWVCLASANNSVWATNGSGVPELTTTLPNAVQDNITRVGTVASGSIGSSLLTGTLPNAVQDNITRLGTVTSGSIGASLLTGTIPNAVQDNITRLGTVVSGTWTGTAIAVANGGTGATSAGTARTNLGLGSIATQDANAVAITGGTITGIPDPTNSSDVATKSYVDTFVSGITIGSAMRYATAAVLPNSPSYSNGASGDGATLISTVNGALTVDGVTPSVNDRILVKNQASAAHNGVYSVTDVGSGGSFYELTRVTDFDISAEMIAGTTFLVEAGTQAGQVWALQTAVPTVGTSPVNFAQYSSAVGALLASNNLSDLVAPATARTNLGLGSIATQAASAVTISGGTGAFTGASGLSLTNNAASVTNLIVTNTNASGQAAFSTLGPTHASTFVQVGDTNAILYTATPTLDLRAWNAAGVLTLSTGAGPTERMRIDSAGAVTVASLAGAGTGCVAYNNSGVIATGGGCIPSGGSTDQIILNTGSGTGGWYNGPCTSMGRRFNGDGVTDNSAAMNTLFTDLSAATLTCVHFPPGVYLINTCASSQGSAYTATLSGVRKLGFYGAGIAQTQFKFVCSSGTGGFRFDLAASTGPWDSAAVSIGGFTMLTTKAGAGNAIVVTSAGTSGNGTTPSIIKEVNIVDDGAGTKYWDNGFYIQDVGQITLQNVTGASCNVAGDPCFQGNFIYWVSTGSNITTGMIIEHADAQFWNAGIHIAGVHFEGLFVNMSNMSFMNYGMYVNVTTGTDCQVTSSQFNAAIYAYYNKGCDGGTIAGGSLIGQLGSGTNNVIQLVDAQRINITGVNVSGAGGGSYNGIVIGDGVASPQFNSVMNSKFFGLSGSAVWLQANALYNKVSNNTTIGGGFVVFDSGSSNYRKCNAIDDTAGGNSGSAGHSQACP